jgi:osmotically inducible lipoprotein OsmB
LCGREPFRQGQITEFHFMTHTLSRNRLLIVAAAAMTLGTITSAEARACRQMNKTEGAVVGAVGGAVLGNVIAGRGSRGTGTVVGAVAGGVAGHEIARDKYNKNCRTYRRTRR